MCHLGKAGARLFLDPQVLDTEAASVESPRLCRRPALTLPQAAVTAVSMTERFTASGKAAAQETRDSRRAEALRENLRRRKQQARERKDKRPSIDQAGIDQAGIDQADSVTKDERSKSGAS